MYFNNGHYNRVVAIISDNGLTQQFVCMDLHAEYVSHPHTETEKTCMVHTEYVAVRMHTHVRLVYDSTSSDCPLLWQKEINNLFFRCFPIIEYAKLFNSISVTILN